ncbi:hypothetical protein KPL70_012257 [Citrus sinensis]|uniref:uncharacterized protein LOC102627681 isoform X2 n=1 Tax=Citrus sinensis TaxID=2711 RepID=UPI0003D70F25|nr:uncharacterized protein LOC102627681 isoform X2 [Citrus sinensis]KAH9706558.1 hypothetical protein KPL70_012257 [Citrus sinensis]
MEGDTGTDTLYLQLHKLSAINSEQALDNILTTLWSTRKTGLRSAEKSHVQSLLNLPSPGQVDPVVASLRSLIRKCVRENFTSDDLLKLFPPDLSLDLQSNLILLLQKHQKQWKEESSREQPLSGTSVLYHVKMSAAPSFRPFPSSVISTPLWPHQDDPFTNINHNDLGASASVIDDTNVAPLAPMPLQRDGSPPGNTGSLPCLKSMTWAMEKSNSEPGNRVAVISLKLQDYTKSPSGETEVKFQLTKDTLEAMLRSLTYINEQLSSLAATSSGPAQKKQKQ